MEVLYGSSNTQRLIDKYHTSKIGNHSLDITFFIEQFKFNPTYKKIIDKLKAKSCDIIIFTVYDFVDMMKLKKIDIELKDFDISIESLKGQGIDYLIFGEDVDLTCNTNDKIKIDKILIKEDYKNRYNLNDLEYKSLRYLMLGNEIVSYDMLSVHLFEGCFYYLAFKEYRKKYQNKDMHLVNLEYEDNGLPYTKRLYKRDIIADKNNSDIAEFSKFLNKLPDQDWLDQKIINSKVIELGGSIDYRKTSNGLPGVSIKYYGINGAKILFEKVL